MLAAEILHINSTGATTSVIDATWNMGSSGVQHQANSATTVRNWATLQSHADLRKPKHKSYR